MDSEDGIIEIDRGHDRPVFSPVCTYCRRYRITPRRDDQGNSLPSVCDAFPEGIPEEIWRGRNKHKVPHSGDHGIQFEPAPDVVPEVLKKEGLA